jgi:hypothetical protein
VLAVAVDSQSQVPLVPPRLAARVAMDSCSQPLAPTLQGVAGVVRLLVVRVVQVGVVQAGQVSLMSLAPPAHLEPPTRVGVGVVAAQRPQVGMGGLAS